MTRKVARSATRTPTTRRGPAHLKPPFRRCILVNACFWGVLGAWRSFGAPLDGLASRACGSDQLPGHDWSATVLAKLAQVKRLGTFPKVIPTRPWILEGLKRVLAGTRKRSGSWRSCSSAAAWARTRAGVLQFQF
jgi:hypothetical protein